MLSKGTIVVNDHGTELAYTDTGAPSDAYTTLFAVHGMSFNGGIFERVQAIAPKSNIRFVAVNRRHYAGSSPFDAEELRIINGGGLEEEKTALTIARGVELLNFIDKFLAEKQISYEPPQSKKPGGIGIIGWSMGNSVSISAFANLKAAAPDVQARLGPLVHTLILHEPSRNILGHTPNSRNWVPWNLIDQTIPQDAEMPFFAWWVSAYFQHGDLSSRNPDNLSYHVPGFNLRPPTVYSIAAAGRESLIEPEAPSKADIFLQIFFNPQYLASYNAIFSKEIRGLYPNLKAFYIGAENCGSYGPDTTWMVQDHDKEHGGGYIKAKLLSGINHFSMWDDPEVTLQAYQECIDRTF